jgi:hypothetical protein
MIYWSKQPSENIPKTIDFTDALPTGETLNASAGTITATNAAGTDVTATLLDDQDVDSPYATIRILPSTAGIFHLRFLLVTTPGAFILEEDVELTVKEQP